jgi:hypothetical protein
MGIWIEDTLGSDDAPRRRRLRFVALACGVALFEAGCVEDGAAVNAPSASSTGAPGNGLCPMPASFDAGDAGIEITCHDPDAEDACEDASTNCRRDSNDADCTKAADCLKQPRCDVECIQDRHATAEVYGGLCDTLPAQNVVKTPLDELYLKFAWSVFTALNHPANASNGALAWTQWYQPAQSEGGGEYGSDREEHVLPTKEQLAEFEQPTWKPDAPVPSAVLPPPDNPPYYKRDGSWKSVRIESMVSPAYQSKFYDRMRAEVKDSGRSRKIPIEAWAKRFEQLGPITLKAAWAEFSTNDPRKEDFICRATAVTGPVECLLAMHVTLKTFHSENYWTWATFEHHDLQELDLRGCAEGICSVEHQSPESLPKLTREPNDYTDAGAYDASVRAFNSAYQADLRLHAKLRRLANYDLIGVQRPVGQTPDTNAKALGTDGDDDDQSPVAVGVWPPYLSNLVLEWDRQKSSCAGCHSHALLIRETNAQNAQGELERFWVAEDPVNDPGVPRSDMFWGYANTGCAESVTERKEQ